MGSYRLLFCAFHFSFVYIKKEKVIKKVIVVGKKKKKVNLTERLTRSEKLICGATSDPFNLGCLAFVLNGYVSNIIACLVLEHSKLYGTVVQLDNRFDKQLKGCLTAWYSVLFKFPDIKYY